MTAQTPALPIASARRPRADAVRNRARIVGDREPGVRRRGADASLEEIARGAGVGIGTLYRHFPTRDDLVEAVFHDRIDELEALAEELLGSDAPGDALATWLHAQLDQAATCRGLAAEAMLTMLADRDAPVSVRIHAPGRCGPARTGAGRGRGARRGRHRRSRPNGAGSHLGGRGE